MNNNTRPFCDIHVHVGYFQKPTYFSPQHVVDLLDKLRIASCVVSSLSTGMAHNGYKEACREIQFILEHAQREILPALWVTPEMLMRSKHLKAFNEYPYYMFKIHGYMNDWHSSPKLLERVFAIAEEQDLPVMLHTGGRSESDAGRYQAVCQKYSNVKVVLAHGRPIAEAMSVIRTTKNVWVDTAFMSLNDIKRIVTSGLSDKIVYGSDLPLDEHFYPKAYPITRYRYRVNKLIETFGEAMFDQWSGKNFIQIVGNRRNVI